MKNITPDEELVRRYVMTRHTGYFEEIYQRYRPKVLRYCLGFVGDDLEAEDLTQDIFIKLLNRLDAYSGRAQFSTWLYTLTRNYCTDHLRLNQKQEKGIAEYCADFLTCPLNAYGDDFTDDDQVYYLQLALGKLPDWERQLLVRKYQQGISTQLIAQHEKRKLSAVKMRLLRARKHLRQAFIHAVKTAEVKYNR